MHGKLWEQLCIEGAEQFLQAGWMTTKIWGMQ